MGPQGVRCTLWPARYLCSQPVFYTFSGTRSRDAGRIFKKESRAPTAADCSVCWGALFLRPKSEVGGSAAACPLGLPTDYREQHRPSRLWTHSGQTRGNFRPLEIVGLEGWGRLLVLAVPVAFGGSPRARVRAFIKIKYCLGDVMSTSIFRDKFALKKRPI